ncbi:MAG TPA: GFA family protein [Verrucomicrobiae bacterium]
MPAANVFHGGCLCGTVRYEATGRPYDITHCHCLDCRRSSGAPFITWACFRRSSFRYTSGQPRELHWAGRLRCFCAHCGTPLVFMTGPDADEIGVTICSLDEPDYLLAADHTWTEDKLPWIKLDDGLPHFTQNRPS